jgi:hypothetical protein
MGHIYVSQIVRRLEAEPAAWDYDRGRYRLVHKPTGVALWVANGRSGAHIECNGGEVWGGVTFPSTFGLSLDHHRVWRAYKKWQVSNVNADLLATRKAGEA